jgi:hypothetical protein
MKTFFLFVQYTLFRATFLEHILVLYKDAMFHYCHSNNWQLAHFHHDMIFFC